MHTAVVYKTYFSQRLKIWMGSARLWRGLLMARPGSYHPEKHYMRGPGPKCREKRGQL